MNPSRQTTLVRGGLMPAALFLIAACDLITTTETGAVGGGDDATVLAIDYSYRGSHSVGPEAPVVVSITGIETNEQRAQQAVRSSGTLMFGELPADRYLVRAHVDLTANGVADPGEPTGQGAQEGVVVSLGRQVTTSVSIADPAPGETRVRVIYTGPLAVSPTSPIRVIATPSLTAVPLIQEIADGQDSTIFTGLGSGVFDFSAFLDLNDNAAWDPGEPISATVQAQIANGAPETGGPVELTLDSAAPEGGEGDTRETARTISPGETISDTIDAVDDRTWYRFTAVAGEAYIIETDADPAAATDVDTFLELYAASDFGTLIRSAEDGGTGTFALIRFVAATSGDYLFAVRGTGDTGGYRVTLTERTALPPTLRVVDADDGAEVGNGSTSADTANGTLIETDLGQFAFSGFTLSNAGDVALTIDAISLADGSVLELDLRSTFPVTLEAAETIGFGLMVPTDAPAGNLTDTVTISSDDPDGDYGFVVQASVQGPAIGLTNSAGGAIAAGDVTPTIDERTDLGSVASGTADRSERFIISNVGAGMLEIASLTISDTGSGALSVTDPTNTFVDAGLAVTFDVVLSAEAPLGSYRETVTIETNDLATPTFTFDVSGTVIEPPPAAATNVEQTAATVTTLEFSWTDNADDEDGYAFYWSPNYSSTGPGIGATRVDLPPDTESYRLTDLERDRRVYVWVGPYRDQTNENIPGQPESGTTLDRLVWAEIRNFPADGTTEFGLARSYEPYDYFATTGTSLSDSVDVSGGSAALALPASSGSRLVGDSAPDLGDQLAFIVWEDRDGDGRIDDSEYRSRAVLIDDWQGPQGFDLVFDEWYRAIDSNQLGRATQVTPWFRIVVNNLDFITGNREIIRILFWDARTGIRQGLGAVGSNSVVIDPGPPQVNQTYVSPGPDGSDEVLQSTGGTIFLVNEPYTVLVYHDANQNSRVDSGERYARFEDYVIDGTKGFGQIDPDLIDPYEVIVDDWLIWP